MQLLYLWIEQYNCIEKLGFNFSSRFIFDIQEVDDYKTINITENPDFPGEDFFENDNIYDISAIVGCNGSGKTTVLDFIKEYLPEGGAIENDAIIIVRENIDNNFKINVYTSYDIEHVKIKYSEQILPKPYTKVDIFNIQKKYFTIPNKETTFIFYSNIFDLKHETPNYVGLHNISTNYLARNDIDLYTNGAKDYIDQLSAHEAQEIKRNINFISSNTKPLEFELPEILYISIPGHDEEFVKKSEIAKSGDVKNIIDKLDDLFNEEKKLLLGDPRKYFFCNIYNAIFYNLLRSELQSDLSLTKEIKDNLKGNDVESAVSKVLKSLSSTHQNNKVTKINEFLKYLKSKSKGISFSEDTRSIFVKIDKKGIDALKKFIDLYVAAKSFTDFLDFKWRNLSSGEQSLLTMYSRFYDLLDINQYSNTKVRKNVIILIDEGDTYFHPEWQRKFFNYVIKDIPKLFDNKTIQFIFATNSPFLTSELPKSNIIYVKKDDLGKTKVITKNDNFSDTFAANIHTLFSNSFFMDNLIGEFAKRKINRIIKDLLDGVPKSQAEGYQKIIEIIGEPVLKKKLRELLEVNALMNKND